MPFKLVDWIEIWRGYSCIASGPMEKNLYPPRGMTRGCNELIKSDNSSVNIGGKNEITINRGERLRISTPGDGGFGPAVLK